MTDTPLRVILFDMDGVLVDSRDAIARSINHALAACDLEPEPEILLHALVGAPLPDVFRDLLAARSADSNLGPACLRAYRERYRPHALAETTVLPGVRTVLGTLSSVARLGVATTRPAEYAGPVLEAFDLLDAFDVVVGSRLDRTSSESKTETVGRALAALEAPSDRTTAMIGDRHFDMRAAHAHGLHGVGVTWGGGSAVELQAAGAHDLAHHPRDLLPILGVSTRTD